MNGTWKEKLGGYDRKGQRRKKQSRKHILKDKFRIIHNRGKTHNEDEVIFNFEKKFQKMVQINISIL